MTTLACKSGRARLVTCCLSRWSTAELGGPGASRDISRHTVCCAQYPQQAAALQIGRVTSAEHTRGRLGHAEHRVKIDLAVLAQDRPIIMSAQEAAEAIAAAIMRKKPPRELVTGGKARLALLGGFIQKWVWAEFVEGKFQRMFGLQGLSPIARS